MEFSFQQLEAIFHRAVSLPAAERNAYIFSACAGNAQLLREVESLLAHEGEPTAAFAQVVHPAAAELLNGATTEADLPEGWLLGPYRIERKLGEGGMGAVYLAADTRLDRQVAVKVISRSLRFSEEAKARFFREARSAAALCHTNVATLHDLGETSGSPWLVMEYVDGTSLRTRLTGPLGESDWKAFATQIAAALEHAHGRRIIHRDIKPENILISSSDVVKVIDFGLARALQEDGTRVTQPNAFIGTVAYAPPEVLTGGSASPRGDIYSAGVVLYEMARGAQPFAGLTGHTLIAAILAGSYPPCCSGGSSVPDWIAEIVHRCMAREPAARFRDGGELAAAVRDGGGSRARIASAPAAPTLAVIDFRNIARTAELDWLGAGIAETLSADLAKIKSVRIASRSRVIQALQRLGAAKDDGAAAGELGRELGARWIVTGGYQQMGDAIRVTATLIDTVTGDAIAAEKIDGKWKDLFAVQDRVVAALLRVLTIGMGTTDEQKILPAETRNMAAYEHYVRARQQMYEMQAKSLAVAIFHFEQAVGLDPDYALAYSGLGTAHALQFIRTGNPADIGAASRCLERAIELDPELGEPYPWLCNIRVRRNDPAGALAAGRKAVELQPDLPESHYFYSGLHNMMPELQPGTVRQTPKQMAEALRLQRRFHAGWLVLGATSMFLGQHADAAVILRHAIALETEPDMVYRFVGSRTLLAFALARQGLWDAARAQHLDALDSLRDTEHVYTTSFQILSACGLGDIELRCGAHRGAAAHYRHAHRILREAPRTLGGIRLQTRIDLGLAGAYAAVGETDRARELTNHASDEIEKLSGNSATVTFESSLAQLWLLLAVVKVRLNEIADAAACLQRAHELGWMDVTWLKLDPELRPLHETREYRSFVEVLEAAPAVEIPMPRPLEARAASND